MESHITVADAAGRFTDIVDRVRSGLETFVVEDDGKPVCRIVLADASTEPRQRTFADLVELLRELPRLDDDWCDIVERHTREQQPAPPSPWES